MKEYLQEFETLQKVARAISVDEEDDYAVVLRHGEDRVGLFDISSKDKLSETVDLLVKHAAEIPDEVLYYAIGNVNLAYMTKEGADWPLFLNGPTMEENLLDVRDVSWEKEAETEKQGYWYNGRLLPLDTHANIKAASEFFGNHLDRFSGLERIEFASAIKEAAEAQADLKVGYQVDRYASQEVNKDLPALVSRRIKLAESYPETQTVLQSLQENLGQMEPLKVAEVLAVVDTMMPFAAKFEKTATVGGGRPALVGRIDVPDAFESVFGESKRPLSFAEKAARLSDEKLAEAFSPVFIERFREDPEGTIKTAAPKVKSLLQELVVKDGSYAQYS